MHDDLFEANLGVSPGTGAARLPGPVPLLMAVVAAAGIGNSDQILTGGLNVCRVSGWLNHLGPLASSVACGVGRQTKALSSVNNWGPILRWVCGWPLPPDKEV